MSKKILFHYSILNVGGAEMSIIRLTRMLCEHGWEVELVCNIGGGTLENKLDKRVKLSCLRSKCFGNRFKQATNLVEKFFALPDLILYSLTRVEQVIKEGIYSHRTYDVAVISLHGLSPRFCCNVVNSTKILHWIRNDLSVCDKENKAKDNIIKYNNKTDGYICVAKTAKKSFDLIFPDLINKSYLIYNVIDSNQMSIKLSRANNPFYDYENLTKVLSVCRLDNKSKAIFRMVDVHFKLSEKGYDFYWFILGNGPDKKKLEEKIRSLGLEKRFILLGESEDPFPYYKYCDFVAMVSYYEGLCGVVNEAKISNKAVVATMVSGINEQLIDGQSGLIVDNTEDGVFHGMARLLDDTVLRDKLSRGSLSPQILDDDSKYSMLMDVISHE